MKTCKYCIQYFLPAGGTIDDTGVCSICTNHFKQEPNNKITDKQSWAIGSLHLAYQAVCDDSIPGPIRVNTLNLLIKRLIRLDEIGQPLINQIKRTIDE